MIHLYQELGNKQMTSYYSILKNALLITSFGSSNLLFSADAAAQQDYATPPRNTADLEHRMKDLQLTAGKKVSEQQAKTFNYEHLHKILGESFSTFVQNHFQMIDEEEIKEKWQSIFIPDNPYNDIDKRLLIKGLSSLLLRISANPDINALKVDLFTLDQQTKEVPLTRIQENTKAYFLSLPNVISVSLCQKRNGDQLGCLADVTFSNSEVVKYYIKTHSGGLRSGHSSAAKLVNPAELLVYKVLENLGVGPQTHFFGRDGENLYIATLDVGTQINSDGSIKQSSFKEYSHYKESRNPDVQKQLWGSLTQLPTDVEFSDEQLLQAEDLVNRDVIAKNFVREVTKLDLLARIMGLTDFQTNSQNYGFVSDAVGVMKAKAVDFRLQEKKTESFKHDTGDFKAFLNGNGCFDYSSTGEAMYYALRKRQLYIRVNEATTVMSEDLSQFEIAVKKALEYVSGSLTQLQMTPQDQASRKKDLNQYADIIQSNFIFFRDQLVQWRPETTRDE